MASLGILTTGRLGFVNMPSIDQNRISARVQMPNDTPVHVTDDRVLRVAAAVDQLRKEFVDPGTGESLIKDAITSSGGRLGSSAFDPRRGSVTINVLDLARVRNRDPKTAR